MKQVVVISGKGGTGKTSITGCLAALAGEERSALPVMVDCDVDAPNLHLLLGGSEISRENFSGPKLAVIDRSKVSDLEACEKSCRFGAIVGLEVDPLKCVGCGVCELVCGSSAVKMIEREAATVLERKTAYGKLFHGRLRPGQPGFGGLITALRMKGEELAMGDPDSLMILDGSPGIGCQVIASLTGCDLALLVTEPGVGALSDLERIYQLLKFFGIRAIAVINRYNLDRSLTGEVERFCLNNDIAVVGKIPFDSVFSEAAIAGRPAVEIAPAGLKQSLIGIYKKTREALYE
ncbi:MAG: ATP-binding protein [Candidatus Auribacterota bacterium]|nr:ATP-binding protein [Candidatus Auribacterota bacterium]